MVMAVVVKTFFLQAFYIPSESMEPTMLVDDKILVQKVSYWGGDVKRGDVVVFDDPGGWLSPEDSRHASNFVQSGLEKIGLFPTGGHLIKRVIGVGGDTIRCCSEGKLTVNGKELDESYLLDESATKDKTFEVKVRKGYLWVMGDNRGNSYDSRGHLGDPGGGQVSEKSVVGKAWLRVWPFGRAGFIHKPETFETVNRK
ncbi:signal peptidase I [Aeromicrobium chenweiae]|uniref:Signal peptidase I n=2 Tax=Aeromicrobium chenweiae TaxID=2079793 RepID=A0A2S0WS96_9ACTN|nr:signal peptidase I [Aeromicrobium chenweiae]TGN34536.1 signal peptidase I [Aeromicrobium chenweiae]